MKRKKLLIGWIIYLTGYVCSYLIIRADTKIVAHGQYTVANRNICLIISLGSWISVVAAGFHYMVDLTDVKQSDPANW